MTVKKQPLAYDNPFADRCERAEVARQGQELGRKPKSGQCRTQQRLGIVGRGIHDQHCFESRNAGGKAGQCPQ